MRAGAWLATLGLVAFAGWGAGAAGLVAYVNWFSETTRAGGDALKVLSWLFLALGLGATVAFVATLVFEVAGRVRRSA